MPGGRGRAVVDDVNAVEQLQARRRDLQRETARVRRMLKNAREEQRREEQRSAQLSAETATAAQRRLIVSAFWVANFDTTLCLMLLDRVRATPPWADLSVADREAIVNDLFLQAGEEDVQAWMQGDDDETKARMQELWVLWAECRTALWVSRVNATRGVAPSSQAVYSVFLEWRLQAPPEYQPRAT